MFKYRGPAVASTQLVKRLELRESVGKRITNG